MKEVGLAIKQIVAGKPEFSFADLITDLLSLFEDVEKFEKDSEKNPFILAGKGKDAESLAVLLAAIQNFKASIRRGKPKKDAGLKKPLMREPVGPSKLGHGFGTYWNNQGGGTTRAVVCEICGTLHPGLHENEISRTISNFLDYQVVEECCGAIIDFVYEELGENFAIAFVEDLAKNPTDFRFHLFLSIAKRAMKEAKKALAETGETVAEISEAVEKL